MRDITIVEGANELNVQLVPIAAALAGSIGPGFIWYEGLADWEWAIPGREIALNEEIHLAPGCPENGGKPLNGYPRVFGWLNESDVNIVGHVDLVVTYPDGTERTLSAVLNQDKEAAPGDGWYVQFEPFISSQEGTYTCVATLSSAGQVLDSVTFTLITVPAVAVGMITLHGTGVPPHSGAPWPTEWTVGWYYADRDKFIRNKEYYPPVGFETPWKNITDPCTPPEPIDLNNLLVKIETYAEDEICPLTGYKGSCRWPVYGPFSVEDGGVYTIDVTTGVLSKR